MSDSSSGSGDAVQQEREMREHERQAQQRDPAERDADTPPDVAGARPIDPDAGTADPAGPDSDADDLDDPRPGRPGPPGNINIGGGTTGGS
jgi:hypothetical protein